MADVSSSRPHARRRLSVMSPRPSLSRRPIDIDSDSDPERGSTSPPPSRRSFPAPTAMSPVSDPLSTPVRRSGSGVVGVAVSTPSVTFLSPRDAVVVSKEEEKRRKARRAKRQSLLVVRPSGATTLDGTSGWGGMSSALTGASSSFSSGVPTEKTPSEDALSSEQLADLYASCIKLSMENKITSKNSWHLNLIDHIDDVLHNTSAGSNFQAASCTLDASVKIFSCRVDSVHNEAFKVLGGLSRGGSSQRSSDQNRDEEADGENERLQDDDADDGSSDRRQRRLASLRKRSGPSKTLESNASLTVKTFDLEFDVDPLFKKMTSLFDDGTSKGLLLNNLGLSTNCEIVFDSSMSAFSPAVMDDTWYDDYYEKASRSQADAVGSDSASFEFESFSAVKDSLEIVGDHDSIHTNNLHLPSIPVALSQELSSMHTSDMHVPDSVGDFFVGQNLDIARACQSADDDYEATASAVAQDYCDDFRDDDFDQDFLDRDSGAHTQNLTEIVASSGPNQSSSLVMSEDTSSLAIEQLMSMMNFSDKYSFFDSSRVSKGWAGPSHWKIHRSNSKFTSVSSNAEPKRKRQSRSSSNESIDFLSGHSESMDALLRSVPLSTTTLSSIKEENRHILPEDLQLTIDDLTSLCLVPRSKIRTLVLRAQSSSRNVMSLELYSNSMDHVSSSLGDASLSIDIDEDMREDSGGPGWDVEVDFDVSEPFSSTSSAISTSGEFIPGGDLRMIEAGRRVQKVDIDFARVAKRVDIKLLKESMWDSISNDPSEDISFSDVVEDTMQKMPTDQLADISVTYCFISLLHLANEHNLELHASSSMDSLEIRHSSSPSADVKKSGRRSGVSKSTAFDGHSEHIRRPLEVVRPNTLR